MVTTLQAGPSGVQMLAGGRDIFLQNAETIDIQPPILKAPGSFPGVERPCSEYDHSPQSYTELKNE